MGGAECNVLLGTARLGGRCGLISRLGTDEFGEFVLETLRGASIDLTHVAMDANRRTGLYFKEVLPGSRTTRAVYYREGSAACALDPGAVSADYIQSARALITTGITALLSPTSYAAVETALAAARAAGVKTIFDPNLRNGLWGSRRSRELLPPLLEHVDMYLGGEGETRHLLDLDRSPSCRKVADELAGLGPQEVVLKRGALGAVGLDENGDYYAQDAFPASYRDAVGAGDAFNAGYLHARQQEQPLPQALRAGAVCGAAVCGGYGDFETFPRPEDLQMFLADNSQGGQHAER
jgi:2-dehydro-3-deoxygluconokinase